MRVKIYIVQKVEMLLRPGSDAPEPVATEVVATKLSRGAAQSIAKERAPCSVTVSTASKDACN